FDDGFDDNWRFALPRLQAHGLTATFFLTTGFVDRAPATIARMAVLWRVPPTSLRPLDWEQIQEMRDAGMAFGSHTVNHPNLAGCDLATAEQEMQRSKCRLEERFGVPVTDLAYPFGKLRHDVTLAVMTAAGRCGYERAVTTSARGVRSSDANLCLPRVVIGDDT